MTSCNELRAPGGGWATVAAGWQCLAMPAPATAPSAGLAHDGTLWTWGEGSSGVLGLHSLELDGAARSRPAGVDVVSGRIGWGH